MINEIEENRKYIRDNDRRISDLETNYEDCFRCKNESISELEKGLHEAIHRTILNKEVLRELKQIVRGMNFDLYKNDAYSDHTRLHYESRLDLLEKWEEKLK